MINPNRITRVFGKKVLLQKPYSNNCAVIAILNAYMQDNELSDKELDYLEKKYNKKYDIPNKGLNVTIAGAVAWDLGYDACLVVTASQFGFNEAYRDHLHFNSKVIRIFSWMSVNDPQFSLEDTEKHREYRKLFKNKIKCPPVTVNNTGCHATLATNMEINGDCMFLNYMIGVNTQHNWFKMGHPKWQENPTNFSGGDIILSLRKR